MVQLKPNLSRRRRYISLVQELGRRVAIEPISTKTNIRLHLHDNFGMPGHCGDDKCGGVSHTLEVVVTTLLS